MFRKRLHHTWIFFNIGEIYIGLCIYPEIPYRSWITVMINGMVLFDTVPATARFLIKNKQR